MSNLLKDASILLTPTGYDNGRMNAIKPYKDLYGPELIVNGDFSNGSTGWTISGSASVGVNKLNVNAGAFDFFAIQTTLTNGLKYKVTLDAEVTSGDILLYTGTQFGTISSSGSYTFYTTSDSTQIRFRSGGSGFVGSITNVSVVEDLSGDFTFTRGSAATRVNAQGLVENVQIISPELVSNGNFSQIGTEEVLNGNFSQEGSEQISNGSFDTDTKWTTNTGWSISSGSANCDGTQSGNTTLVQQNGIKGAIIDFVVGKTYKVNFDIVVTSGVITQLEVASGVDGNDITTSGNYTTYITAVSTNDRFTITANSDFIGSIDNVSVKEVGQNWDFGGDWTVGENKIIHPAGSSPQYATQDNVLTIGKNYTYSVELLTGNGSNFAQLYVEGVGAIAAFTNGAGVYTGSFTASGTNIQIRAVNADIDVEVTNISIKEVGQDWIFDEWTLYDNAGDLKAKFIGSTSGQYLKQENVYTPNTKIRLQFTISNLTSGQISIISTGVVWSTPTISTNGTFTYDIDTTGTSNGHIYIRAIGGSFNGYIDNISVKEITDDTDIPRINYSGFSYQDVLGSELIAGGDFSYDSGWSGQKTIANGQLTKNGSGLVYKAILDVSVKDYKVVVDVDTAGPNLNMYLGGAQQSLNVGINTIDMQSGGSNSFVGFNNGDGSVINSISVKEVTGQEVVPDSGCGSWLLEPQSTNTVPYSSDFSQWVWGGDSNANNTTRVDNQSSPDGETNAALFTRNAGTSGWFSPTNLSVVLNQTYTYPLFVKKGTSSTIELRNVNNSPQSVVVYNIDTDTFTTEQNATGSSVDYGNGWYRIAMTFEHLNTSTTSAQIRHTLEDGESMYVFGSQFENLPYATSYIPTNGATNTRLKDIANNSGNASLINSTEGVLYVEIAALADDGTNRCISLYDGSVNNRLTLVLGVSSNSIRAIIKSNNSTSFDEQHIVASTLDYHKICVKYKENDFALWINGVEVATDTSGVTPIGLDRVTFDTGNDTLNFYGKCKALAVYKEALTDAQLQSLTTI